MNERTIVITLTETQCNTLANLLDVSVRAGGMQNAKLAVPFVTMMEDALHKLDDPVAKQEAEKILENLVSSCVTVNP
jgi:hypothetical protein